MMGGQTHKQFTYTCIQYCAPHLRLQEMKIHTLLPRSLKSYIAFRCRFVKAPIHTLLQDLPTNVGNKGRWKL